MYFLNSQLLKMTKLKKNLSNSMIQSEWEKKKIVMFQGLKKLPTIKNEQ